MAAARAVTNSQTSKAPAVSTTPPASTPAATPSGEPDKVSEEPKEGELAPALFGDKDKDKDKPADDDDKGDDKDAPKTPDELAKGFIRLTKREKKLRRERRELNAEMAKKKAADDAKEAEFEKARREIISEHGKVTALQRATAEKYGWVAKGQTAWDNDDKVGFAKAVEKMAKGASLAQITQWLAGALTEKPAGQTQQQPSEEEQAWRREKAEFERQRAEEQNKGKTAKTEQEKAKARTEAKARLATAFATHPFLKNPDDPKNPDPDAIEEAFEKVSAAIKAKKPGETAKVVAKRVLDELHAREVRKLKRFGIEPKTETKAEDKAKDDKKEDKSSKPGTRLPEPPPTKRDATTVSLDATRAERIAAARRLTEQQRRGVAR